MPGTRHAKNNTALGFFTASERRKLGWGSQKVRLTKESVKNFDACSICLKLCEEPLICPRGDIFCKACIYESLLVQKRKIKKQKQDFNTQQLENRLESEEKIHKKAVDNFMQFDKFESSVATPTATPNVTAVDSDSSVNTSIATSSSTTTSAVAAAAAAVVPSKVVTTTIGNKNRKPSAKAILNATDPRDKNLSCFWIPTLTPDAGKAIVKAPDCRTYCPACNQEVRLKQLVPCKFTEPTHDADQLKHGSKGVKKKVSSMDDDVDKPVGGTQITIPHIETTDSKKFMCPACRKQLTNSMKLSCLKKCGHILCFRCVKRFVATSKSCVVCDEPCRKKDVIIMAVGGTGFAAHSGNRLEAVRKDVAFQG